MALIGHELTPDPRDGDDDRIISVRTVVYVILLSRKSIVTACLLGILGGFYYGAIKPNVYEAFGKLHVRSGRREAATPETAVGQEGASVRSWFQAVATELHLLRNPLLAERVVQIVGAERILSVPDPRAADTESTLFPVKWLHEFQAWWFGVGDVESGDPGPAIVEIVDFTRAAQGVVTGSVKFFTGSQSPVIDVIYVGPDPQVAKEIVDAYLEVAEIHHRDVFSADPNKSFLQTQADAAMAACEGAEEALRDFRHEHDIFDFVAQMATLLAEQANLLSMIASDEELAFRLQTRLDFYRSRMDQADEDTRQARALNPLYNSLHGEFVNLRNRRFDMVKRSLEVDSDFQIRLETIDQWIEDIQTDLAQQDQYLIQEQEVGRRTQLSTNYDTANVALAEILVTREPRKQRLAELSSELLRLRSLETKNRSLTLHAEQCKAKFDQVSVSLEQVGLMSLLDSENLGNLTTMQNASLPEDKASPSRKKFLLVGAVLGLLAGMGIAFARVALDGRVRRAVDLKSLTKSPVFGIVRELRLPHSKARGVISHGVAGRSPFQGLIDRLWSHLLRDGKPSEQMTIAFVGDEPGQGCSTVAAAGGLGLALRTRQSVLIIETDFEQPGLTWCFGLEPSPGLSEVLAGEADLADAIRETGIPGLSVLGAGAGPRPEPGTFATEATKDLIREATTNRQFVVYDLAPMQQDPDSRVLLWETDAVVTVARANKMRKDAVRALAETIRARGANLIGCVLNGYRSVSPFWLPGPDPDLQET